MAKDETLTTEEQKEKICYEVTKLLMVLNFNAAYKGFNYLKECITYLIKNKKYMIRLLCFFNCISEGYNMKKIIFLNFLLIFIICCGVNPPCGAGQDSSVSARFSQAVKAAEHGDAQAQYLVGSIYETGSKEDGIKADIEKARKWYEKAASGGSTEAVNSLAVMYYHGMAGLKADAVKAVSLFEKTASENDPVGTFMLGSIYYKGVPGVSQDIKKGTALIQKACDQGNPQAQDSVAMMYLNGENGFPRDGKKAESLFMKSALSGYVPAHVHMGSLYYYGSPGVKKDQAKGFNWMKKAASLGNDEAVKILELWEKSEKEQGGKQKTEK